MARQSTQQTTTFQSTVNGLKFSVPQHDENNIRFLQDPSVQPFIVPEQQIQYQQEEQAQYSGLGDLEIVNKETKTPPKAKTTPKPKAAPTEQKGTVELE